MTLSLTRVALPGASGRMGRMITIALAETDNMTLAAATDHPSSEAIGQDTGRMNGLAETGVLVAGEKSSLVSAEADVIIDFTTPQASVEHARLAAEHGIPIVIGTTGMTDADARILEDAAGSTAVVWCANTSVGVTLLSRIVEDAVRALGSDWDIEIVETHHKHKVDAPSGTALLLGEAAAKGRDVSLADVADYARHGITGARKEGAIGFGVLRGGDVVGEHSVMLFGQSERIELTHRAIDRMIFARGALRAGRWAAQAQPGIYSMHDVLKG